MPSDPTSEITECTPAEAWAALEDDPDAQLVDVRTRPEWSFVGLPDLSALGREPALVEWRQYPMMSVNDSFVDDVRKALGGTFPSQVFLICRSGARSMEAAHALAAAEDAPARCINVAEGFEGDLDMSRHRGSMNGWKARGLTWRQG